MEIIELKEAFIERHKEYKNDIDHFFKYLKEERDLSISDKNMEFAIGAMDTEKVKESLKYLVDKKTYTKQETAKKYAVVIGQFFEYMKVNSDIKNKDFFEEIAMNGRNKNSYIGRMMKYIEGMKELKPKEPLRILHEEKVLDILQWCDKRLEDTVKWEKDAEFRKVSAAIGIKLMLMYGVTYRQIRNIKISQIMTEEDKIVLGGFELRLPIKLNKQINKYIRYKCEMGMVNQHNILLTNRAGVEWIENSSSSGIPDILKTILGVTDITGLVKYGICQLIKIGMNDQVIKEITGAGNDIIKACIQAGRSELIDEINNKLVTVELYYMF